MTLESKSRKSKLPKSQDLTRPLIRSKGALKRKKKPTTKTKNPTLSVTNLDIARVYMQANSGLLPKELITLLDGALRSRDIGAIRKAIDQFGSPQLYESHTTYYAVSQLLALLSKVPYPFGGGDEEREATAVRKFLKSEVRCRITTRRLKWYDAYPNREDEVMRRVLCRARVLVDRILGDIDDAGLQIIDGWKFGPGMTSCSPTNDATTPYYKLTQSSRNVTARCLPYADLAVHRCPIWAATIGEVDMDNKMVDVNWNVVRSCRLTFVPKDERTFRTIAIEPFGNVMIQLGVHKYIKERLANLAGIYIEDQSFNQRAAEFGSKNWDSVDTLSTIDLSSASDCVSPGLLQRLVRPQWRAMLDDIRCTHYEYKGQEHEFSKWSSMGNGCTFALETLLFWALAQSCEDYCGSGVKALAYGDDIVVSRRASLLTLQTLRYAGFQINTLKTFVQGPFRESCGKDFHSGVSVRPVYLKVFKPTVTNCFSFLNQLKVDGPFDTDEVYKFVVESIPPKFRVWGPPSASADTHLHAPWFWLHEHRPKGWRWDRKFQRQFHHTLVFKTKLYGGAQLGSYVTWLYNTQHRQVMGEEDSSVQITRRSRGFYRVRSAPCSVQSMAVRDYFFLTKG